MTERTTASRLIGIVAGLSILAVGWFGVLRWTLIPVRLDTRVADTSYEGRTAGHFRVVYLTDGRDLVVDREFVERVGEKDLEGSTIRKRPWEDEAVVGGATVPLHLSPDIWRTLIAVAVPVTIGYGLRWQQRPARPGHRPRQPQSIGALPFRHRQVP